MKAKLSRNEAAKIGRLLLVRHPNIANQLLVDTTPTCKDFEKISRYLEQFKKVLNGKKLTVNHKREFIAAIFLMYYPGILSGDFRQNFGIVSRIAKLFKHSNKWISNLKDEAITHYQVYDSFKHRVDLIIVDFKKHVK